MNVAKALILGRVGSVSDLRKTKSNISVLNVRVAVNQKTKAEEITHWFALVFWGKYAEVAANIIEKGDVIFAEAEMRTTTDTTGKEGRTEFHVNTFQKIGGGGGRKSAERADRHADGTETTGDGIPVHVTGKAGGFQADQPTFTEDDIPF